MKSDLIGAVSRTFDYHLFDVAGTPVTVATMVIFLVILLITYGMSRLSQRAIAHLFKRRGVTEEGTAVVVGRLIHYIILLVGLGIGLQTVGINLTAAFAAGAVLAVGVGLAMQNLAQNFVSGVILLLERSIKPGDILRVENQLVKVSRMALRATHARTLDDEEIIVPNSTLVQSSVTNYTLRDSYYRLRCPVGVVYGSDMGRVKSTLQGVANAADWRSRDKAPIVLMTEFGSSSVDFEVSVWIDDPWAIRKRRSDLNEAIWDGLKQAGITIAFPQLDVHFDPPALDAFRARATA